MVIKYITIKHSVEPDIYYESNFKMTMEEYLCLVASILSVWFGFSIILFTDFISTMVMKLNAYKQINLNVECTFKTSI